MLKKTLVALLLLLLLLSTPLAAFASVHIGGDYFLKGSKTIFGNLYVLGESATFAGTVQGDIVSLASDMTSESTVKADILLIGGKVVLSGKVGDDARLIGQTVTVSGAVAGDVVAFGTRVIISPTSSVGGNLYVIGGDVSIQGKVAGEARVYARKTILAGTVEKGMESWGKLTLLPGAFVGGDLFYHMESEIAVPQGASIKGGILRGETKNRHFAAAAPSFRGLFPLGILSLLALGFLLLFLARNRTEEVLQDILPRCGQRLFRGTLIVVCGPVLIGFLLASVVGIPVALVFLCLYVSFLILGSAFGALLLGAWCERLCFKQSAFPLSYRPVLLGSFFLSLMLLLPYAGFFLFLILLLAGVGGLGTVVFGHLRQN
ncbi:MAG: hypothetical protein AAB767_03435 [Patescibacteria group bacterium]